MSDFMAKMYQIQFRPGPIRPLTALLQTPSWIKGAYF